MHLKEQTGKFHMCHLPCIFFSVIRVSEMSGLEGKIVLVTGASSGIGAEAAKHFAALKETHHLHKG